MDTLIRTAAAAVIGARHQRAARNGQDAVATWASNGDSGGAVVVVCDGCSSGASSEVGARLGASLFAGAVAARLQAGESPGAAAMWCGARADVIATLAALLERMPGDRAQAISESFLFTVVAAAATRDAAAVWALGDGAYSFGDPSLRGGTRVLGPFADNAPPYLAYDLLGDPRPAHLDLAPPGWTSIVIATDGATDLEGPAGLERFAAPELVDRPDALRRRLALLARTGERIDWIERRVVRTPAALQDDCAIGVLHRSAAARSSS
jgi:hypothetical protein